MYRRRFCIYIEKLVKEKVNGQQAELPIHPSNVEITALRLDADRKAIIARKQRKTDAKNKQMQKLDWARTRPGWTSKGFAQAKESAPLACRELRGCARKLDRQTEL